MSRNINLQDGLIGFLTEAESSHQRVAPLFMQAVLPHLQILAGDNPDFDLTQYQRELKTIHRWAQVSVIGDMLKLNDVDRFRLGQFSSLQAVFEAAKADTRKTAAAIDCFYETYNDQGDVTVVKKWDNGFSFVRLDTPVALQRNGFLLQNCMAYGDYDKHLGIDGRAIYSLYDPNNLPHAHMDVWGSRRVQCKGKQNAPVILKYFPYIWEICHQFDLGITTNASEMSMVYHNNTYHSIYALPRGICFFGGLNLTTITQPLTLPAGSGIHGNLLVNTDGPKVNYDLCDVSVVFEIDSFTKKVRNEIRRDSAVSFPSYKFP